MKKSILTKKGFTLIEVLTVVAIIGILSAVGYAGLQQAIANSRVKDAAFNMAAFIETAANKANQLNDTVCVMRTSDKVLTMYKGACASETKRQLETLEMVVGVSISESSVGVFEGSNLFAGANFVPRFGLSAAPIGYFVARYMDQDLYGAALKSKNKNTVVPKISYDGTSWSDL